MVYALAVASPGPGVAAVVARSLAKGTRGAAVFIAGFAVGDLVWFTIAATGMAALAQTAQTAFLVVKYAGAAYLLYLAYQIWRAPPRVDEMQTAEGAQKSTSLFLGSLALTLGNPKTIIFFLALLPTVVPLEHLGMLGYVQAAVAIAVILPLVLAAYVIAGARARTLLRSPRAIRAVNGGTGAALAGAAIAVVTR